jgi:hypothetical protein
MYVRFVSEGRGEHHAHRSSCGRRFTLHELAQVWGMKRVQSDLQEAEAVLPLAFE